jgi:hypothetical protein
VKRPAAAAGAPAVAPQGRRQHARLDIRMSAEIRTSRAVFTATTRDLSEAGAGLETDRALGLFLVEDGVETETPPLWVKAKVAWTGENDAGHHTAGVRFTVVTNEQRAWLRAVLAHVQPAAGAR